LSVFFETDVCNQKYGENVEQSLEKKSGITCVASAQESSSLEVMMKEMLTLLKEDRQEQQMTFGRGRVCKLVYQGLAEFHLALDL
jgi:plasmid maintenance system killer protein